MIRAATLGVLLFGKGVKGPAPGRRRPESETDGPAPPRVATEGAALAPPGRGAVSSALHSAIKPEPPAAPRRSQLQSLQGGQAVIHGRRLTVDHAGQLGTRDFAPPAAQQGERFGVNAGEFLAPSSSAPRTGHARRPKP